MAGYVRVDMSNNIADGNVISATDLDNEFDGIQAAFNTSTGHNHDGTTGEGAPILVLGPTQDVVVGASTVTPKTTNTVDIGSSSLKFKDLFLAGNTSIGGTTTLSGLTASTALALDASKNVVSVTNTGTGNNVLATSPTLVTPALGTPSALVGTNITGTAANFNINGTVGATTANTGSFTTLTTSGAVTHNGGTANGVAYLNGSKVLTTGSALTFDGTIQGISTVANGGLRELLRLSNNGVGDGTSAQITFFAASTNYAQITGGFIGAPALVNNVASGGYHAYQINGSEQMRLTSTGLGIGTSSPVYKLVVSNGGASGIEFGPAYSGTANLIQSYNRSGGAYVNTVYDANEHIFNTIGTQRLRLDSSGNLGLGVTPSAFSSGFTALQFGGNPVIASQNNLVLAGNAFFNSGWKYIASNFATRYDNNFNNGGIHAWFTAPSGTAGNAISFTQAMTLTAAGKLGVGTTGPNETIQANGTVGSISNSGSNGLIVGDFGSDAGTYAIQAVSGRALRFFDAFAGAERARINSSGRFLVGTTVTNFGATITAFSSTSYTFESQRTTTGNEGHIAFVNANGAVGTIFTNGSLTLYNTTSDYRLKTVIGPVANAGQRIDALQPVEYTWNVSGERTRGFLAHQFQEVYAGSVSGTKDAVDAEGKPVYQSMQASTAEVIADLVAELQSLRARVAQLESN